MEKRDLFRFVPNALASVTLQIHKAAMSKSLLVSTAIVAICLSAETL